MFARSLGVAGRPGVGDGAATFRRLRMMPGLGSSPATTNRHRGDLLPGQSGRRLRGSFPFLEHGGPRHRPARPGSAARTRPVVAQHSPFTVMVFMIRSRQHTGGSVPSGTRLTTKEYGVKKRCSAGGLGSSILNAYTNTPAVSCIAGRHFPRWCRVSPRSFHLGQLLSSG